MDLVAESRHLRMSDVLSHPLGPLPWTIANADGAIRKTNKDVLASEFEKDVLPAEPIPEPSVTITDGMNLVQKRRPMAIHSPNLQTRHWRTSYMKESGVA